MQLHQHKAIFVLLELVLLWHYLNNDWYVSVFVPDMHSDFRFALPNDQYKGIKCWAGSSISSRISRYINLKLTFSIVSCNISMFTFSNFNLYQIVKTLWHLKNLFFFLLLHTACISLALPLSLLPFTCDTHMVFLQWNVSQRFQIHLHKKIYLSI